MMSRSTLLVIAAAIVLGTGGGLLLYRSGILGKHKPAEKIRDLSSASPGLQPPHARGDSDAPVTLEEFADFQCASCGVLYYQLKMIEAKYGSRLRIVFRQYPLQRVHKNAMLAARASEAADLQGQFWEMHDRLYQTQVEWAEEIDARQRFIGYARDLRLDVEKFERDMDSEQTAQ